MSAPTRLVVTSVVGVGRDFRVATTDGSEIAFVDGKLGVRPRAEIQVPVGQVVLTVTGRVLGIPRAMSVATPTGTEIASVRGHAFSPIRSRVTTTLANGTTWDLVGNVLEKEYTVTSGGRPVAQITQKWVTLRDTYTVDVANTADVPLVLALAWAVDSFHERG